MTTPASVLYPTRLAAIRAREGHTFASMALGIGVPINRYKPWDYGHSKPRDWETQQKLTKLFKVPFDELFAPALLQADGTITRLSQ